MKSNGSISNDAVVVYLKVHHGSLLVKLGWKPIGITLYNSIEWGSSSHLLYGKFWLGHVIQSRPHKSCHVFDLLESLIFRG
jgi:hypothetical protein